MSDRTIARRYANALFALTREQDALEPVRSDLMQLAALMDTSTEWRLFVTEPSGTKAGRAKAIAALLEGRVHPLTLRFVTFLDHKSRLPVLALVVEAWLARYDQHLGLLRASITSAAPLNEQQVENLRDRLARRFGGKVVVTTETDASLIGGFRIFIGDHILDYSVETRLQQLKQRLIYA